MTVSALRLAFYGDDFTGSTDALEVLAFAGIRAALFLQPPTPEMLARFKGLEALGVAGDSRAMTPEEMDQHLPGVFDALAKLGAPLIHYKVCSTFDSGQNVGSIGRVMEIAQRRFAAPWLPVVAATPKLGRWCLFGNLFARSATDGEVYRIDRHPIMSVHPVTPMSESDLTVHLGLQGSVPLGSLPFDRLEAGIDAAESHLARLIDKGRKAVVLDAVNDGHMCRIGKLLARHASNYGQMFVVGSSGAEYALTQYWNEADGPRAAADYAEFSGVRQVLAVSGSASELSARQIEAALAAGFADVPVDASAIAGKDSAVSARALVAQVVKLLQTGRSVIIHTARGHKDPRITALVNVIEAQGLSRAKAGHEGGRLLGRRLGEVVRDILAAFPIKRLLLSGGDTSSQVTKVLAPDAIVIAARLAAGAPLCRLIAPGRDLDGLEVALKGGQMGGVDYFIRALKGTTRPATT